MCKEGSDCCRFQCQDDEYIPKKCTDNFECGYKASIFLKYFRIIVFRITIIFRIEIIIIVLEIIIIS